jgi:hypothetical protein
VELDVPAVEGARIATSGAPAADDGDAADLQEHQIALRLARLAAARRGVVVQSQCTLVPSAVEPTITRGARVVDEGPELVAGDRAPVFADRGARGRSRRPRRPGARPITPPPGALPPALPADHHRVAGCVGHLEPAEGDEVAVGDERMARGAVETGRRRR